MPTISVIVPVYNVEKYLRCCVDSILAQTYTDIEILLVDDGSTDGSSAICDEYAEKDSRVQVFHKENGGVSSARNMGLDKATGKWIMFVDSDDKVAPQICERLLENAVEGSLIICACYMWQQDELIEIYPRMKKTIYPVKEFDNLKIWLSSPWARLFERSVILKNELQFIEDLSFGEDRVFNNYYLQFVENMVIIGEPLYYYRILPYSLSKGRYIEDYAEAVRLYFKSRMEFAEKINVNDEDFCKRHFKAYFLEIHNAFQNYMREDSPGSIRQKLRRNNLILKSEEFRSFYPYRKQCPQFFNKRYIFMLELSYHTGSYFWLWLLDVAEKIRKWLRERDNQ